MTGRSGDALPAPDSRGASGADREARELVLSAVRAAGFDRVGFLPLSEAADPQMAEWIRAGFHGTMAYLSRHATVRRDPVAAFPAYSTVVVASLDYGEVAATPSSASVGNISRYALGDDYHGVLKARLRRALERVREARPGLAARVFVDAGPLNEKLIAERSGLGWVGRNTNLINTAAGSYGFLGLMLVGADLGSTGPATRDRCGLCTACIPACPTGAIVAPYVLDARLCISYLTIELRGPIPRELRGLIGNRIFGCDDCQEVCPWNRFARRDPPEPFLPRTHLRTCTLAEWLELPAAAFEQVFANSAVLRPGWAGFQRNVLVAAGCARDVSCLPGVSRHLSHGEPLLRGHAAWAWGCFPEAAAPRSILREALDRETDSWVREELEAALDQG